MKNWLEEYKYDEEYIYYGLMLDLSYYLKQLMIEKGLNKKQLAQKMGVSPAYITKIFSGQNISLKTVAKILSALEVDAGIKIIDREKISYKTAPNRDLFKVIKKEITNESKSLSTAA
ncbi:helix-turn-helix domain-containing protein [Sulfurihydrogenibium subterraneum]|uniref:helix-turn-helix domain-containing protein n=1 Tax=Sulfurihydrogenibium subterraneum TaxID=171121 RepID=UPI0006869A32|nr:helix-turn-helix transcriptional regulator [Sulfurihydrogenibium subterraneum]